MVTKKKKKKIKKNTPVIELRSALHKTLMVFSQAVPSQLNVSCQSSAFHRIQH